MPNGTIYPRTDITSRPPAGLFAYVLFDWQLAMYDYKPRSLFDPRDGLNDDQGYPQTCPFSPRPGVQLTERLQWFWVEQLCVSKYRRGWKYLTPDKQIVIKEAWRGLTKSQTALTNRRGTDVCWDYIRGINEDADLPMLFENACGGTTIELSNRKLYSKGYEVKTLRVRDYDKWKNWTFLDHPQYFAIATNATVIPDGGKWRVDPFHYLGGADVPFPILSEAGVVYVAPERVRILGEGEPFPYPYYPKHEVL